MIAACALGGSRLLERLYYSVSQAGRGETLVSARTGRSASMSATGTSAQQEGKGFWNVAREGSMVGWRCKLKVPQLAGGLRGG